nr:hypothetical protein Q903MT_gene4656 [Picea sitchensis]
MEVGGVNGESKEREGRGWVGRVVEAPGGVENASRKVPGPPLRKKASATRQGTLKRFVLVSVPMVGYCRGGNMTLCSTESGILSPGSPLLLPKLFMPGAPSP